jgi:CheY-like chemotaxis protein
MSTARGPDPLSQRLVLIASPSSDEQAMYAEFFASEGFRVAIVSRGDEAIATALALTPTIVVSSLELPGQDGTAVCRALKHAAIPVILLASAPIHLDAPCAAVMWRPALPSEVADTVGRVLNLPR